jgi:hypothetical protein
VITAYENKGLHMRAQVSGSYELTSARAQRGTVQSFNERDCALGPAGAGTILLDDGSRVAFTVRKVRHGAAVSEGARVLYDPTHGVTVLADESDAEGARQ